MHQNIIIGSKEYGMNKIAPFQANALILKIQKLVLPIIGTLSGGKDLMEMDLRDSFDLISEKLDPSVVTDLILPMFKLAQVASVTDNLKIDSEQNFNKVFESADNLMDFYELTFEVLKYNFGNFFAGLATRFGNNVGAVAKVSQTLPASEN